MRRAVFLDRDDTLIQNSGDLGDPDGVRLVDGAAAAVATLRQHGFAVVVVTNQAGVARGAFSLSSVAQVHQRIMQHLAAALPLGSPAQPPTVGPGDALPAPAPNAPLIEAFFHCPFHPEATVAQFRGAHPWRKPAPGMLLAAANALQLDLTRSWMVGDAERDVEAGAAAGCRTIRLGGATERATSLADFVESDLPRAVARIIAALEADDRPRASIVLRALSGEPLAHEETRNTVTAAARAIAERNGVTIESLTVLADRVRATLVGEELVAIGFAAELRRATEQWYRARHGTSLWGTAP